MNDRSTLLLEHHLKELKLPSILREYGKMAALCAAEGVDHPQYLLRLAELELIDRHQRMVERRIRAARFPAVKSLDTLDFPAIPSLNKALVMELARCEYIQDRENVIAVGNSGTGKTHVALALGLGLAACQRGMSVGFTTAAGLVHEMMEARDERRLLNLQKQLARLNLLIVDELGFVPLSRTGAELLFEVFSQRYERGSTYGDHQPALRRVDRGLRLGTAHRSAAGPAHPPRPHPGDERRELPAQAQPGERFPAGFRRTRRGIAAPPTPSPPVLVTPPLRPIYCRLPSQQWYTITPPQWPIISAPLTQGQYRQVPVAHPAAASSPGPAQLCRCQGGGAGAERRTADGAARGAR